MDRRQLLTGACLTGVAGASRGAEPPVVAEAALPAGGFQPQLVTDRSGGLHLAYLKGDPRGCDVYYARRPAGQAGWGTPLRVNSIANSGIGAGTIRGVQISLGKSGRPHFVWAGGGDTGRDSPRGMPLFYSRLDDAGTACEPQRDVSTATHDLDGGPSVAADEAGRVAVVWHAGTVHHGGETARAVWIVRSTDGGRRFGPEEKAWQEPTGTCACCNLKALYDSTGRLHVLYRGAVDRVDRDVYWLTAAAGSHRMEGSRIDRWRLNQCPMASHFLLETGRPGTVLGGWETAGQVRFARQGPGAAPGEITSASGSGANRKHPVLALNRNGWLLFAWTEGTGFRKGGDLAWELFDPSGVSRRSGRVAGGIPVWGLPAAAALPDGSFLLLH